MVISKRSSFWILFFILSSLTAGLSYKYFDQVSSIVHVSITVDRYQVIQQAREIASQLDWDISDYCTSVEFSSDDNLQSFVELEAGGKKAFVQMFQSGLYNPYQWQVRFFKEQEIVEMRLLFSPEGTKLGFYQKVAEDAVGAALSKQEAQKIVEQNISNWCPNFEKYYLVEYDSEKQDTGRIDHSFIYERSDITIGKGLYRFQASVSGDVITKFEPGVKVPDNFIRRYQEMRSANQLLSTFSSFLFRILYFFIFCLFGLFYFYRRNYLLVKPAFKIALFISGLECLSSFNNYPLWWFSYNTIQSSSNFIMMQCFSIFMSFATLCSLIFMTLVVAEAAGRYVYKQHVQFFSLLSWPVISSQEVFKQVVVGYFATPFAFGYVILFGYITETYFSWWSPASSLSDPNIMASYLPWLGSMTMALQAGFLEEVIFRALPLAMIVIMTKNNRYKKQWFVGMFLLQACIFGGAHAFYANQPFYARLVELIIPSFGFGFLYYYFGLLPGIIVHFTYDAILMAIPVFISNLVWSKIIVISLISSPLWIVVVAYLYNRKFLVLSDMYKNSAFHAAEYIPYQPIARKVSDPIPARNFIIIGMLGLIGFVAWLSTYHANSDTGPLLIYKSQAIEIARGAVEKEFGVSLDQEWKPVCFVHDDYNNTASRFVWQVYGKNAHKKMQGSYIQGATWLVRFVQFHRQVEDRAEEFQVRLGNVCSDDNNQSGELCPKIIGMEHILPEHYHGADISEEQALQIAYEAIKKQFDLEMQDIVLVSVSSEKLENRRDWTIVVQDLNVFDFNKQGQARIHCVVSGDVLTQFSRYVYAPEDWTRQDKSFLINLNLIKTVAYFILLLCMIFAFLFAVQRLLVSRYGAKMMLHKGAFLGITLTVIMVNSFCINIAKFKTSQPFYDQFGRTVLQLILSNTMQLFFCIVFLAVGAVGFARNHTLKFTRSVISALFSGIFIVGVGALLHSYEVLLQPETGLFGPIGTSSSLISLCGLSLQAYCLILSIVVAIFLVVKTLQKLYPAQFIIPLIATIIFCISLQATVGSSSIQFMVLSGIILGIAVYLLYYLLLQYEIALLPLILGVFIIFEMLLPELLHPSYINIQFDVVCAMIIIVGTSLFFYERAQIE